VKDDDGLLQRKFMAVEIGSIMNILDENGIKAELTSILDSEHGRQLDFKIRGKPHNISKAIRVIYSRESVESVWSNEASRTSGSTIAVSFIEKKW
jgi:hypothetical protein